MGRRRARWPEQVCEWMTCVRDHLLRYPAVLPLIGRRGRTSPAWLDASGALLEILEPTGAMEAAEMSKPSRIKPPLGPDNAWWWEQAAQGRFALQRCVGCGRLRHPPRPMCDACRSMEWDFALACGRATLHSYTVIHHPRFPGYDYPIVIALVDLEEGERAISELVDCEREAVRIGMPLELTFRVDADGFRLPVFRPAA